jgi:pimeloyl-ACP methyl ester carboxylesterase
MRHSKALRALILFSAVISVALSVQAETSFEKVSWTTPDGWTLSGLLSKPAGRKGVWVLLHGLGSGKGEWQVIASELAKSGQGVLIYDARGHAESIKHTSSGDVDYRQFQTVGPGSQWDAMTSDLASAVSFLKTRGIPASRVAVGGASLGANVALVYAAQHREVPAVLLLSAGMDYAGVRIEQPWKTIGPRKILIAASPGDRYAFATLQVLAAEKRRDLTTLSPAGAEHGVNMFKDQSFKTQTLDWMRSLWK